MKQLRFALILMSVFAAHYHTIESAARTSSATHQDWQHLIKALESADYKTVQSIIPSKIGVHQKTRGGKTPLKIARFWLEKRNEIVNYMRNAKQRKLYAANKNDWDTLLRALETASLATIKHIVPHKINPFEKTKSGRSIISIAQYYRDNQEKIVSYFNSLAKRQTPSPSIAHVRQITFYHRGQPYYEFTNFYPAQIVLDGKTWPTSEHYFQAQKFIAHPALQAQIRNLKSPREVFEFARAKDQFKRKDWDTAKDSIMKKALFAKFTQHKTLKNLLLGTGKAELIEASDVDAYWGWGPVPHKGQNKLGKFLMELRSQL